MTWRPLLRIARRDALRARGRSVLIVLMVLLPVAGVAFVDVMLRTSQIDGRERLDLVLGRMADARVLSTGSGDPALQAPDWDRAMTAPMDGDTASPPQPRPPIDPTTLFPKGSRWITDASLDVTARTTDGLTRTVLREYAYTDPIAHGTVLQLTGRAPHTTSEVAVTESMLDTLGLSVGDRVELTRPVATFTIVGTYRSFGDSPPNEMITLPGAALPEVAPTQKFASPPVYIVDTPRPVTWQDVLSWNERGVGAYSRYVVEHPPARSEVPLYNRDDYYVPGPNFELYLAFALIVSLAVLEVALLAGAAFAVGARRQSRALGLLAATGGTATHVRRVVLAQGLVLGTVGGVVGGVVGTGSALAAIPMLNSQFDSRLPAADVRALELTALVVLGIVTGLLAAALPARAAARQDVVAALRGRRGVLTTRRRLPVIGLVVAAVGAALALGGGAVALGLTSRDEPAGATGAAAIVAIVAGAILTQLGLIVATPAIVGALSRLGGRLPLAPRLALRDAARHRGRSAPAVAAILAAVAGSVSLTLYVSSLSDHDRRTYYPSLGMGQYVLRGADDPAAVESLPPGYQPRTAEDVAEELAVIRRVAPPDDVFGVTAFSTQQCAEHVCRYVMTGTPKSKICPLDDGTLAERSDDATRAGSADPRCGPSEYDNFSSQLGGPVIGGYDDFVRLTGLRSTAAHEALAKGGMVVFDPRQVDNGWGYLNVTAEPQHGGPADIQQIKVPAAFVDARGKRFLDSFVSAEAARKVDVAATEVGMIVQYETPPDDNTEERVQGELAKIGRDTYFQVERGYRDRYGPGLLALLAASAVITLGSAAVATGLAQADARADHATLAAVGAPPRVRRSLAAWQSAAIAGLGALLGTLSGFLPTTAFLYAQPDFYLVPPWRNIAVITVVIPIVAALAAWALTRSRLPLERRIEA